MRFFSFVEKAVLPYPLIACSVGGAFFAFFLACFLRKTSAFFFCGGALALVCAFAAGVCRAFSAEDKKAFCICLLALYAILYAAYLAFIRLAVKKEARRRKFMEMKLRAEYVLPERGNGYVRDKLRENSVVAGAYPHAYNTDDKSACIVADNVLSADSVKPWKRDKNERFYYGADEFCEPCPEESSEENGEARIELAHARGLIKKLKKAELTLSDRLETERLEKEIAAFSCARQLTAKDIRTLSDSFSALLKLTAKYVV